MRFAIAAVFLASAATAHADLTDESVPLTVRSALEGTSVKLLAQFRVRTTGPRHEALELLELELPASAVVTGATVTQGGVRHRLALDTLTANATRFEAIFTQDTEAVDAPKPKPTPTMWAAKVELTYNGSVTVVVAAPIETAVLVDLELFAPTCFFRDARYLRMPAAWARAARATPRDFDVVDACGGEKESVWIALAAPEAARMPSGDRLATTTTRLAIDPDLHVARTELALAANLADIPADLATVILVDESRSMTPEQRRAQQAIVSGYLRAAPNSRVRVIGFARRPRKVLPGWVVAMHASARIERELASVSLRNGSNFDIALAEAGRELAAITGTRRVLLITDEAMAQRLEGKLEPLANLVPAGTLINVAVATADAGTIDDDGAAVLARFDDAKLARLAAATEGFATNLGPLDTKQTAIDAMMLARPISLDHVRATGLGWIDIDLSAREKLGGITCMGSIAAGDSCVWWTRGTRHAGAIQLEGLLWNRRVMRILRPLGDPLHTIAREIVATSTQFDGDFEGPASDKLGARIDALAHAVTSTTSLFGRWGGSVPFDEMFGFGGFGISGGTIGTSHIGHMGPGRTGSIGHVDLASQLKPLVNTCNLGTTRAYATLEFTFQEIVAVTVRIEETGPRARVLESCVEEALWDAMPVLPTNEPTRTETALL